MHISTAGVYSEYVFVHMCMCKYVSLVCLYNGMYHWYVCIMVCIIGMFV